MKLSSRIIILAIIVFILFVSYKILEPNIIDKNSGSKEGLERIRIKGDYPIDLQEKLSGQPLRDAVITEITAKFLLNYSYPLAESPWDVAENIATERQLHPTDCKELGSILHAMTKARIETADVNRAGTQLKMTFTLPEGQRLVFKPKWFPRDKVFTGIYEGWDRHNGELVAFHIGRLLEFNRTPLVIGRKINLRTEVLPRATSRLKRTFFTKGNSTCFYGMCYYCKGESTGVCGEGDVLEGVVILWLPTTYQLSKHNHPWRRTYKNYKARWEADNTYCTQVRNVEMYRTGPRLLDLIDITVLDYLTGNADRHHYETNGDYLDSPVVILDNGKSFGNPYHDEESILASLYQCCRIRFKTWQRLLILQDGVLSAVLREILKQDPISPVLTEAHLVAVDRRVRGVLAQIQVCIDREGLDTVLVKDDYTS